MEPRRIEAAVNTGYSGTGLFGRHRYHCRESVFGSVARCNLRECGSNHHRAN